jgi:hypothetical protein
VNKLVYQENEDDSFTHDGKKYNLNALFRLTYLRDINHIKLSELAWILEYTQHLNKKNEIVCNSCRKGPSGWHIERVSKADITKPILVIKDNSKWVVLDGVHRLEQALNNGITELPAIIVTEEDLKRVVR